MKEVAACLHIFYEAVTDLRFTAKKQAGTAALAGCILLRLPPMGRVLGLGCNKAHKNPLSLSRCMAGCATKWGIPASL